MSIADNQLWLSKKQKKGGDAELRPKNPYISNVIITPTLALETHFWDKFIFISVKCCEFGVRMEEIAFFRLELQSVIY